MRRTIALWLCASCGTTPPAQDAAPAVDAAPDALVCPAGLPPETPSILEPLAGRIDVLPGDVVIASSPFADADPGDVHAASEVELWRMDGPVHVERVWRAEVTDPYRLTRVTLADGVLEGSAAAAGGLAEWTDYAARVRYRAPAGDCGVWSGWSADRAFRTDDGSTYLYDPERVHTIELEIPPESWGPIDAEAVPPGCVPYQRNYYRGTLRFEGVEYPGVGIKVKGGCGSARGLGGKAAFKVNLMWDDPALLGCPEKRRLHGQTHLTLNNLVQDPSFEHERLGYHFYRAMGVAVPRAAHVRLMVNGAYWGTYLNVETIDRRFLARWFEDNDGMLYEGTYWCDLVPWNVPPGDEDTACLTREFKPDPCDDPDPDADPQDYTLLRQFVAAVDAMPPGGFYPEILAFFDYDRFLSSWAVEAVISHWDAYEFSIMNNYRVYHDPDTGLWTLIPTGIDQTFAGDQDPWDVYGVLARRCIEEPDCEAAFAARLHDAADTFEGLGLGAMAGEIHDQIAPHVAEDPRREVDLGWWQDAHEELLWYIADRPARVRQILGWHGY